MHSSGKLLRVENANFLGGVESQFPSHINISKKNDKAT